MLFNVPQFIDVEDKIAGPFTAKQLLWMFGMGAVLLILWGFLSKTVFFITAVPVVILFLALAFYRPYRQPLIKFILSGFMFALKPKFYVWKRVYEKQIRAKHKEPEKITDTMEDKSKKLTPENIAELAKVLDTGGREKSEKVLELIREEQRNKK